GRVVVVQSTEGRRADLLNEQQGRYHILVRGLENGQRIDRVQRVESVSRALNAVNQWDQVLALVRSPQLRWIVSNTTEPGYTPASADRPTAAPPRSSPAKLLVVLHDRFRAGAAPLTIVPCELFEKNADRLRSIVAQLARDWQQDSDFIRWLDRDCVWLN